MSNQHKYREVKHLHLPDIDSEILAFWKKHQIFEKSIDTREGNPIFVFFEGPPSTNGLPGIHHVMGRTVKDLFCRYQTLKGKQVSRKGGWDTHGLPIELNVEKRLGIRKDDIGVRISVENYNKDCREDAMRYIDIWNDVTQKMGYWVDMDNAYITYKNEYIECLWWLLQQFYNKGLLYKGYTIQPYSPAAGTGLSSHEINQPGCYKEITDTTVVAMFKVVKDNTSSFLFDDQEEDVRILAWTTTPWTLPSNTALTVGTKINYVKIKTTNPYTHQKVSVVLAEALVKNWFGGKNQPSIAAQSQTFAGKQLNGIRYEQLLPFGNNIEPLDAATDAFRVILGDFVTTEDGTGVVHTAPSFGADDRKAAREAGIGTLTLVDKQGKFIDTVGEFSGRYVKNYLDDPNYISVDVDIAVRLKLDNKALNVQKYVHNYPHCWRTDKPILYYPLDSWFIAASKYRSRMSELNRTINWKPASTGEGRFQNWLENIQDWNLSRSRYWGCPLPIWRTANSSAEICIGSLAQLQTEIDKANRILGLNQTMPPDLHRPYIDNITLATDQGEPMQREADLIDVWFDSGAVPYAQWGIEYARKLQSGDPTAWKQYPADFIAEGVDQTRGWFYTLHAIAVMLFDSVAYKNVVSNGLLLDENGVKMSKRLGNVVDPFVAMDKYGVDTVRWYIISNSNPWDNLKFSWKKEWNEDKTQLVREYSLGMEEVRNKFLGTLFNTYSFFALYANIDGFNYAQAEVPLADRPEIDRWILSLLNSLIKKVDAYYATYDATPAARLIQDFVSDHLSNWYVRLCRRRFWKGEMGTDKLAAYQTLYRCLEVVCQLASPIAPFITDFIFRNLNNTSHRQNAESVHLSYFPVVDATAINVDLEERMQLAQTASSLVLALRKKADIKVRQPLQKILIPVLNARQQEQFEQIESLILAEVNVKQIEFVNDTTGIVTKSIKPDLKKLGKKLGGKMKAVTAALAAFGQDDIKTIEQNGSYNFTVDGETINVLLDEVLLTSEDITGWLVNSDKGVTVALDVNISPELEQEGIAREIINRLQNLRKTNNFNVTDRIQVQVEHNEIIAKVLNNPTLHQYICSEVLADSLTAVPNLPEGNEIDINELVMRVAVEVSELKPMTPNEKKFRTVIDKNTFYFYNPIFQERYESYINSLNETLLVLKNEVETKGLKKEIFESLLSEKENGLRALLALTGFANESIKRLITVVRVSDNQELAKLLYKDTWSEESNPDNIKEWGDSKITTLIQKNEGFRKGIVNLFFEGASVPFLAQTLPLFELKKLSISKLKFEIPALIDSLVRYKEKGSYSGQAENNPEYLIASVLQELGIAFEKGDLTELFENEAVAKRTMDFIIPNKKNPKVIMESSFLVTTSSGQGDKAKTENNIKTLIGKYYPNAKFIGFVDGIGWYVRKGDVMRIVSAFDDVFTFHKEEIERFKQFIKKEISL